MDTNKEFIETSDPVSRSKDSFQSSGNVFQLQSLYSFNGRLLGVISFDNARFLSIYLDEAASDSL